MDTASTESSAEAAREAHIQRLTDAHSLRQQLVWMSRAWLLLPMDALWVLLAVYAEVGWGWVLPWFAVRAAMHAFGRHWARALQPWVERDPAHGIVIARRAYIGFGLSQVLMFPAYFFGTDDNIKLLAMLLATSYGGTVVVSASGRQWTYWLTVGPAMAVMLAGWAMRGGALGWVLVTMILLAMPITALAILQQRRAWEELVRLQDDKQRLATAVAAERDRAQAASDARTRFFAAASHDLRQPLHALSLNATTLLLLARRAGNGQLLELSNGIARSLAQSQALLDALLDISRLDAGAVSLHLADVDLNLLLHQLHAEFMGVATLRRLDFGLQLPACVAWARTDADQLLRILRNLLDNAFKFTESGAVRLLLYPRAGPTWAVQVADTGRGIAQSDRDRVFEAFVQLGNPARDRAQGLGLGLAIVQRTAALLGLTVTLRDGEGGGTVFELALPMLAPAAAPASALLPAREDGAAAAGMQAHLTVLLVDDEADIQQAQALLLRTQGFAVRTAGSAGEAMATAADEGLALSAAVLDHRLPDGSGAALAEQLRALRPQLSVLVVTGDVDVQWQVRRCGLRLLHKPLQGSTLVDALRDEVDAAARYAARAHGFSRIDGGPPMNLIDALHGRRSVRRYRPDPLPRAVVEDLVWHAAQVPRPPVSSADSWCFHVVQGAERLATLGARAKRHAAEARSPGLSAAWAERGDFEVFWGAPLLLLIGARRGSPEAPFDACRAGQNLVLAAHARGLGSCWIGAVLPWLGTEEGRAAVALPEGYDAAVAVVLGYAEGAPLPGRSAARPEITWAD